MTYSEPRDDEMNGGLSVAEREILQKHLRLLPDTLPPRAVWQRIEQQARAEGLFSGHWQLEKTKWLAGVAVAASVAMLALNVPMKLPLDGSPEVQSDGKFSSVPKEPPSISPYDLNALKVESQILERNLRLLPDQPRVMRVSTATTIHELEDRIGVIDYRLNDRNVRLDPRQQEIYWEERVRLMKSLVHLRYAQAQRISF